MHLCRAIAVYHMFCLFMFWMHNQSNTMTISSEQKNTPSPLPNPPPLCFLFKMHSMELHFTGLSELLFAFLCTDTVFQVTSPLSASIPVMVLYPLMNHKQGVLRSLLTEGQLRKIHWGEGRKSKQLVAIQNKLSLFQMA